MAANRSPEIIPEGNGSGPIENSSSDSDTIPRCAPRISETNVDPHRPVLTTKQAEEPSDAWFTIVFVRSHRRGAKERWTGTRRSRSTWAAEYTGDASARAFTRTRCADGSCYPWPEPAERAGDDPTEAPVSIDRDLIERSHAYEDARLRIREEFLQPDIGGGPTVAVLSTPVDRRPRLAVLICPSFGPEHTQLNGLEVAVARSLAAAGSAVLRYQSQGYADSLRAGDPVGPDSHLSDAVDAAGVLAERAPGAPIVTAGGLFGGSIAALAAQHLDLSGVVMWEPAVDGARYGERMLRNLALQEMAFTRNQDRPQPPMTVLRERLAAGEVDAQGFRFTKDAYDRLAELSLLDQLGAAARAALIVAVSRSTSPSRTMTTLAEHLVGLGWNATLRVVVDRLTRPLGTYRFVGLDGRPGRLDTQFALNARIAEETVAWVRSFSVEVPA